MLRRKLVPAFVVALLAACSSSTAPPRATDARVRSFRGQSPPEIAADVRWLNAPPASLASLHGRVVFLQFAFPT